MLSPALLVASARRFGRRVTSELATWVLLLADEWLWALSRILQWIATTAGGDLSMPMPYPVWVMLPITTTFVTVRSAAVFIESIFSVQLPDSARLIIWLLHLRRALRRFWPLLLGSEPSSSSELPVLSWNSSSSDQFSSSSSSGEYTVERSDNTSLSLTSSPSSQHSQFSDPVVIVDQEAGQTEVAELTPPESRADSPLEPTVGGKRLELDMKEETRHKSMEKEIESKENEKLKKEEEQQYEDKVRNEEKEQDKEEPLKNLEETKDTAALVSKVSLGRKSSKDFLEVEKAALGATVKQESETPSTSKDFLERERDSSGSTNTATKPLKENGQIEAKPSGKFFGSFRSRFR